MGKLNEQNMNNTASGIQFILYIIILILTIIWIFKLHSNAKSEPKSRDKYILEEPSNYYREDEFCYEKYESFIISGALELFDLPMKNIKKYCKALISTIFISIGSVILAPILVCCSKKWYASGDIYRCFAILFYIIFILGIILSIVFAIVLIHYYSKGNYNDFEEFSRCRYLSKQFRIDYNFVFKIKNEFKLPFAVVIIMEFFNFIKLVAEMSPKDE